VLLFLLVSCSGEDKQEAAEESTPARLKVAESERDLDQEAFNLLGQNLHMEQLRHMQEGGANLLVADRILAARYKKSADVEPDEKRVRSLAPFSIASMVVRGNLPKVTEVSDEEAEEFYKENASRFVAPARATAYHLFVEIPPGASEEQEKAAIAKMARAEKDYEEGVVFPEVCNRYSEDSKAEEGSLIKDIPQGRVSPVVDEALFALEPGGMTEVLRTRAGLHIFQLVEKQAKREPSFEDLKESIKDQIRNKKASETWTRMTLPATTEEEELAASGILWSATGGILRIMGLDFDRESLEILNVLLTQSHGLGEAPPKQLVQALGENILAAHKPGFNELLDEDLYEACIDFTLNWHLAKRYCAQQAEKEGDPTEEDLRGFYMERRDGFSTNPSRRASMIYLPVSIPEEGTPVDYHYAFEEVLKQANAIVAEAREGRDFAELAKEHSEHPSAEEGGYLGWLQQPSFYEADVALSKMTPGEICDPFKSDEGFYIFQLHEVRDREPIPFEEITDRVRSAYLWHRERDTWNRLLYEAVEEDLLGMTTTE